MSKKSRNSGSRARTRERKTTTRTDFKLYSHYRTRQAAEADVDRLLNKAEAMIDNAAAPLVGMLRGGEPGVSIQPSGPGTHARAGHDYQSIIITKERMRGESSFYYAQDKEGEIERVSAYGLHEAEDDDDAERPYDPRPSEYEPDYDEGGAGFTAADAYEPLKGEDGKRDKARRFIHSETGEIISRRAHLKLQGIIPEVPKAQRWEEWDVNDGDGFDLVISYGETTND